MNNKVNYEKLMILNSPNLKDGIEKVAKEYNLDVVYLTNKLNQPIKDDERGYVILAIQTDGKLHINPRMPYCEIYNNLKAEIKEFKNQNTLIAIEMAELRLS